MCQDALSLRLSPFSRSLYWSYLAGVPAMVGLLNRLENQAPLFCAGHMLNLESFMYFCLWCNQLHQDCDGGDTHESWTMAGWQETTFWKAASGQNKKMQMEIFYWNLFYRIFFIETPPWCDAKCCRQRSWQLIWRKVSASTRPVCEFYLVINASPIVNSDFRKVSKAYRKMEATEGVLIAMITMLWCLLFNKLHHGEIVRYYIMFSNKGGLKKVWI